MSKITNKQCMNGTVESQRFLSFQGLECVIEDLASLITSAGKCKNAENPIGKSHCLYFTIHISMYACLDNRQEEKTMLILLIK